MNVRMPVPVPVPVPVPESSASFPRRPLTCYSGGMTLFDHERLDAYKIALTFAVQASQVIGSLPPGRSHLADQLHRASLSVALNIAEGAGEFSRGDKARFYRMAKRSATECAAILDVCVELKLSKCPELAAGRESLFRVVSMLTKLVRSLGPT